MSKSERRQRGNSNFLHVNCAVNHQYDAQGYLTEIDGFDPALRTSFGYDGYGRLASKTSYPEASTVALGYEAVGGNPLLTLDRPVSVTYPDGSYGLDMYLPNRDRDAKVLREASKGREPGNSY